jgi:dTDP-4-amino-4,6-dideoxygalactose transaminase
LPVYLDPRRLKRGVVDFALALRAEGIDLNAHYAYLIRDWPWARRYLGDDRDTEIARRARDTSFCLYLNENYGVQEAQDIVDAIKKVETHLAR